MCVDMCGHVWTCVEAGQPWISPWRLQRESHTVPGRRYIPPPPGLHSLLASSSTVLPLFGSQPPPPPIRHPSLSSASRRGAPFGGVRRPGGTGGGPAPTTTTTPADSATTTGGDRGRSRGTRGGHATAGLSAAGEDELRSAGIRPAAPHTVALAGIQVRGGSSIGVYRSGSGAAEGGRRRGDRTAGVAG